MKSFISLQQGWKFQKKGETGWHTARVPGCVHTDLLRNKLIPDPFWGTNEKELQWIEHEEWVYQTDFTISSQQLSQENIDLLADGLDTLATIFVNGKKIATTENMFVAYRFPLKKSLVVGRNTLCIRFAPTRPYILKKMKEEGCSDFIRRNIRI